MPASTTTAGDSGISDPPCENSYVHEGESGMSCGQGEMLDVLKGIRGQQHNKNECKFIIVTGEKTTVVISVSEVRYGGPCPGTIYA